MQNKHPLCDAIEKSIIGSGGGGDKPRTPIESPDSLRSIAYARILDIISEGEIYGFADQENPMTCVFLNETPVQNADGSLNFKNVQIDSRVGTQTQDYIKGFPSVESENLVNLELRKDIPWVRTFTNLSLSAVNIKVSTPLMQRTNTTNGDISGTTVKFRFDISVDGGPFQTLMYGAFTGKTTTKYERGHRIDLPAATTGWTIRVTRTTPDSTSAALSDAIYLEAFTEIIDAKLRYPMTALVASVFDASQFPNIPSRAFRMRGRIIRVPSNYDPDTRTYDGVWDGTFQSRYSNNPAWVFYDMATNARYGLGQYVSPGLIDKWFLYSIAQHCDGMVDDGFGGQEPRFTCNAYFQTQNDALKVMSDLASVFRGIVYAAGGAITAVADKLEDPVYQYTNANVIEGKFTYGGSAKKVRHTVALVSWNDMSDFGRAKVEYVDDEQGILRYGVQQTQVIAVGCTSRAQARRLGRYILATERLETDSVGFSVGLDGTLVAPGKIILVADSLRAGKRIGGRIVSASTGFVRVDSLPDVAPGDTLYVISPSGDMMEAEISAITGGDLFELAAPLPHVPLPQSVWTVATATERPKRYRVVGVTENEDATGYVISAIENVEAKYAYAEDGIWLEEPETPRLPPTVVPSPENLLCEQRDVVEQNTTKRAATVSWDAVYEATFYNLQWRSNYGSWIDLGNNPAVSRDIYDIPAGPFEVQVVAITSTGQRSLPTFGGPYDITPPGSPPGYVEEINNDIAQEIIDRFNADAEVAANAAADATAKANAALAAAQAYADVIAAQLNDIIEADEWNAATNYIVGDIVQWDGKLYRSETDNINQQPDTNPDDWLLMGNYASLGEAVAASIQIGTQNTSDIEAVSTSLSAVVARMPAGSGELATQASVADEATARATEDTALGNRITVVEARMPAGSGTLATASALSSLDARVSTAEGTITSQGSAITAIQARMPAGAGLVATASSVSALDARVTTAEGNITSLSSAITTVNARLLGNVGGNRLKNPAFINGSNEWWNSSHGAVAVYSPRLGGYHLSHTTGAGERYIASWLAKDTWNLTKPGEISTFSATVNCDGPWRLAIQYRNDANVMLQETAMPDQLSTAGEWVRASVTSGAAPAGTTWWVVVLYATDTTSQHRMFHPKMELGTFATPYSEEEATRANATAITALDTRVTSAEGTLSAVASAVTQVRSELGGGGNLLANTDFEVDTSEWSFRWNPAGFVPLIRNLAGDSWRPTNGFVIGATRYGNPPTDGNGYCVVASSTPVPIKAGDRICVRAKTAAHRCAVSVGLVFLGPSNENLGEPRSDWRTSYGGTNIADWADQYLFATAPANTRSVIMVIWVNTRGEGGSDTGNDPFFWFFQPQMHLATANQTLPPPYSPGSGRIDSKYASVTQSLSASVSTAQNGVNTLNARYTLALDVNGYVSGIRSENTGVTSTFDILSDNVRILKPGGGARIEMSGGNIRVYDAGGMLRVRMGVW